MLFYFSIFCILFTHLIIDIDHQLLLDKLNIYLLIIIVPYAVLNYSLFHWLVGGLVGFFGPYLVSELFYRLKKQDGLGVGGGHVVEPQSQHSATSGLLGRIAARN